MPNLLVQKYMENVLETAYILGNRDSVYLNNLLALKLLYIYIYHYTCKNKLNDYYSNL